MSDSFQAKGKRQGDWFEETSQQILKAAGFGIDAIRERIHDAGVEVDIIVTNRHAISFYITCKGSYEGERPGCERTDTLKKAYTEAAMLHSQGWGPVLLLTSHKPTKPSGRAMVNNIDPEILFDILNPMTDFARLKWLAEADETALRNDLQQRRTLFVVARPNRGFTRWYQEEHYERTDQTNTNHAPRRGRGAARRLLDGLHPAPSAELADDDLAAARGGVAGRR